MSAALALPPETPPPTPARATQRGGRPALHLVVRPAPRREPPFDDELEAPPAVGRYDQRLPFAPVGSDRLVPVAGPRPIAEPIAWARRLLVGLIESADGRRPLQQLAAMLSPSISRGLGSDFDRAAAAGLPHWLHSATVLSLRGERPAEGVAELCATIAVGERVRAVALRLETHRNRWVCTRLQLG